MLAARALALFASAIGLRAGSRGCLILLAVAGAIASIASSIASAIACASTIASAIGLSGGVRGCAQVTLLAIASATASASIASIASAAASVTLLAIAIASATASASIASIASATASATVLAIAITSAIASASIFNIAVGLPCVVDAVEPAALPPPASSFRQDELAHNCFTAALAGSSRGVKKTWPTAFFPAGRGLCRDVDHRAVKKTNYLFEPPHCCSGARLLKALRNKYCNTQNAERLTPKWLRISYMRGKRCKSLRTSSRSAMQRRVKASYAPPHETFTRQRMWSNMKALPSAADIDSAGSQVEIDKGNAVEASNSYSY